MRPERDIRNSSWACGSGVACKIAQNDTRTHRGCTSQTNTCLQSFSICVTICIRILHISTEKFFKAFEYHSTATAHPFVEEKNTLTNLLMVLDSHAQSIDQNRNHNPSAKVLAVHDLPESVAHQPPEVNNLGGRFPQPPVLLFGLPAVSSVPVVEVLSELVYPITV